MAAAQDHEAILDGRYALGELIGRGAHADVVSARDLITGREHAIKIWRVALELPPDAARWSRELSLPAGIQHPAIVSPSASGLDHRSRPYAVMERLHGEDLERRLARGPLSMDEALDIFDELIDAIAAAHRAGIVHRDLKPANVFLERTAAGSRRVRLLDFGCALPLDLTITRITADGVAVGTIGYTAPEQVHGRRSVGCAADVWAIGVMLYESLVGRAPFGSDNVEDALRAIILGDYVPLREAAPHLPPVVASVIETCLRVAVSERYVDAAVLQQAWAVVRTTRAYWNEPIIPATRPSPPAAAAPDASVIPTTRPRQPVVPVDMASAAAPASIDSSEWFPEPSDFSSAVRLSPKLGASHPEEAAVGFTMPLGGAGAAPAAHAPAARSKALAGHVRGPLAVAALALFVVAVVLFVGRDSLIVPILTGTPDAIGGMVVSRFWTPVVTAASGVCACLALFLGGLSAVAGWRRG